ncbi:TetR/AcrR family transcriptional regulator [Streptomyces sp. CB01881]|uniref:TetR/AcrR family transcriptional regulator n=1 Tax=Streptomyces sp. CB01881 TaxID=2078691 RepID=UPI0011DF3330|nr:TetR/AcrR family transcriptional regulator [Streptomyces sp. CB01881]TYC68186.1 TetR/AcrR family transcriptional regulator [Streptomyces sp. CB01881]
MNDHDTGLRARLVTAGVELVTREGVHALTLREIARQAGVSHGAPRRHFATHVELLSAIARHGFEELGTAVAAADATAGDAPRARLAALSRGYLDYAAANPGMFELMFRHDLLEDSGTGLRKTSLPLFETFARLVAEARPPSGAQPAAVAGALWANLHGLAQLRAWGSLQLATGTDDIGPLLTVTLAAHLGPEPR